MGGLRNRYGVGAKSAGSKLGTLRSKALFTFVGGVLIVNPLFVLAQNTQPPKDDTTELETVIVTGIRNSLEQSMGIKRDAQGVVDAISAEDIGKFPDTNLAESLQRITGISIERRNGEGAQVTVRGFGPQFNTVTLDGRQIPGADAFGAPGQVPIGGVDGGTRAFNFAQLSSDAISAIEVYKTGRANAPSGGIGATINIQTDRPFNHKGGEVIASVGVKAISDRSEPFDSSITPDFSGIFSYANPDKTWGISLNASYQKRHGGSAQATENAWNVQSWTGTDPALRSDANVQNAPAIGQLYAMPNDLRYAFQDFQSKRLNGQAVLQFAPTDSLTMTLDYTFAKDDITEDRGEQTIWLQRANSFTDLTFDTDQAVATPTYLRDVPSGGKDFGYEQQHNMQQYKLNSLGFNAKWEVNDNFLLTFDAHDSKSQSLPNDPYTGGGSTAFSLAGTNNCTDGPQCGGEWAQEFYFNNSLPIASRTWFPSATDAINNAATGVLNPDFTPGEMGSQVLRIDAQTQITEIKEGRVDGEWDFDNGRFQFGADSSKTNLHRLQATEQYDTLGDWSVANAGQFPDMMDLIEPVSVIGLFNGYNIDGAAPGAWRGNADQLADWSTSHYDISTSVNPQLAADNKVQEKTNAVYMQLEFQGQIGNLPTNTRIGVRYEKTDVVATSAVAIPSAILWQANNDFMIQRSSDVQPFSEKASYSNILPNLDFDVDFTDNLKGRASFSKTLARAPYSDLYAGPGPNQPTGSILINPSTRASGSSQNPSLKPLDSDNLDLALEWYFAPSSYVSVTYWNKRVDNFIGTAVTRESLYDLRDPTSGPDAQAALAFLLSQQCKDQVGAAGNDVSSACSANDTSLFTAVAMLRNADATGGLNAYNGSSAQSLQMENNYDLVGEADDPLYLFDVSQPVNQHKAGLHGWEFGGQYFLGDSGFGVQANYTIVQGDVHFDDAGDPGVDQFALTGLSDSANAVLMYEKYGWSVRLAWNWRDKYLIAANQNGSNRNPYYVDPYKQVDVSVNYSFNKHLSVGFEGINLTGEDVRWHGRSMKQVIKLVDQSPRYMVGVRYKF